MKGNWQRARGGRDWEPADVCWKKIKAERGEWGEVRKHDL